MTARALGRAWRIASVFVPPLVASAAAFEAGGTAHFEIVGALVLAWWVMSAMLFHRYLEVANGCREDRPRALDQLDILTGTGRGLMWTGCLAFVLAADSGWASLGVVGVLGVGTACAAVTWTSLVAGGYGGWARSRITREILPARATEGDPLREHITIANVRIPSGMRLFVQGRAAPHGATTRHCLGSEASAAEVELQAELGPAPRGEHTAPPLALWFGDALGLTRTSVVSRAPVAFSAVPRPSRVDGVRELLGTGGDDAQTRPAQRMPTEGTFRIREYVPGDDTRRIHWVRSLQANQLVVRLPDELPEAEREVRLVLDNCLPGTEALTCVAHHELLDAMVRIWLGVGNALVAAGARVTLVTGDQACRPIERVLAQHATSRALQLGARVAWQPGELAALVGPNALARDGGDTRTTIVVTCRPRPRDVASHVTWIVVPQLVWTIATWQHWPTAGMSMLPYPAGSEENRRARRRAHRRQLLQQWHDESVLAMQIGTVDWRAYAGALVAKPRDGRVALELVR